MEGLRRGKPLRFCAMRMVVRGATLGAWFFLLAGLVSAPVLLGSTRAWAWPITALIFVAAAFCAAVRFGLGRERGRVAMTAPACLALLVVFAGFQSTPLPRSVVKALAPERVRQDAEALEGLAQPSTVLAISVSPDLTTTWAWKWGTGAIAMTLAALLLRRRRDARFLMFAMAIGAGAQALFGVVALSAGFFLPEQLPGRATGTFINPNHFAGLCEVGLFLSLGILFDRIRRMRVPDYPKLGARLSAILDAPDFWKAGLIAALVLAIAIALVSSLSRGAVLAGATGFVIFTILFVRDRAKWLVVPALLAIVGILLWVGTSNLEQRLDRMFHEQHEFGRPALWGIAFDVFKQNPATGAGLGAFAHSQVPHWPPEEAAQYALYAHNDYLDVLAGGGLAGALLFAGMFTALALAVMKRMGRGVSPLWIGAVSGVGALMTHAVVEFNWHIPGVATWFFVLCGAIVAPCFRRTAEPGGGKAVAIALGGAAVAGLLFLPGAAAVGWHAAPSAVTPAPDLVGKARTERLAGRDPVATIIAALVREPMPGGAHVERALWAGEHGDIALSDECFIRAVKRDPGNIAVATRAKGYWMVRLSQRGPDPAIFAQLERVCGPVLWNASPAQAEQLLKEYLAGTGSREFVERLVPRETNPSRPHWERRIREFLDAVK